MAETLSAQLQLDISRFTSALQQASQRVQAFAQSVSQQMASATASLATNTTATKANADANNALLVAMQNLQGTARQQLTALQQLTTLTQQHTSVVQQSAAATTTWSQAMSVASGIGLATSIQGIIGSLVTFTKSIITTGVQFEQLRLTFAAVTGSAQAGAQQFQFVITTAQKLGLNITNLAEGYKQLAAATRGTTLAGAETMRIFEGVTTAARAMGSSQESVKGALLALEQMVSKGTVSMEELRRQLGNALPGAFQLAAKAIGVTTEQLNELVRSGELRSIPFVKAFGRVLLEDFAPAAQKATASAGTAFQRLGNEIVLAKDTLSLGLLPALRAAAVEGAKFLAIFREYREAQALLKSTETEAGLLGTGTKVSQFTETQLKELQRIQTAIATTQAMIQKGAQDSLVDGKTGLQVLRDQEQALLAQVKAQTAVKTEQDKTTAAARQSRTERERETDVLDQIRAKFVEIEKEKAKFTQSAQQLPAWLGSPVGTPDAVKLFNTEQQKALAKITDSFGELLAQRPNPAAPLPADILQGLKAVNAEHAKLTQNIDNASDATRSLAKEESAAAREAARLAKERIRITEDITAQIIGIEEGTFEKKKALLAQEVAEARKAGVDKGLIAEYEGTQLIKFATDTTAALGAEFSKRVAQATAGLKAESLAVDTQQKALAGLRTLGEADDPIERQRLAGLQRITEYRLTLEKGIVVTSTQLEQDLARATTAINQKALDERQKQDERAAHEALKPWEELAKDIQDRLSSAFQNVLSGTFSVWNDIKQGFIKLLSDLAAAALTQQILIPVAMGIMGASGGLVQAFTGGGGSSGTGGFAAGTTGADVSAGTALASGSSDVLKSAIGMAGSGASIYSGLSGNSLLGGAPLIGGILSTPISSIGATSPGQVTALSNLMDSVGLEATTIGDLAGAAGVGIAAGQIFAKLNAMLGLHGTGNAVLSGAGGGAIAGTMILPGIGTVIGAAIGALGGYISTLFGNKKKPEPLYDPRAVQAGQVAYDPTQGLHLTTQTAITRDVHRDVGGLAGWQKTVQVINTGLGDMTNQVVSQFQSISPELQQALVAPLNAAFADIAAKIGGLKITGKTAEEFTANLQTMMGTTLPGYFNDAMSSIVVQLQATVKKIEPVFAAFDKVIATLQKDIDAIHGQQLQMHVALESAKQALLTTLQSPAEAFMTAQGQYTAAKTAFGSGNAQQQIQLAPVLAQAAQQLLSMSKTPEVLGQDPELVKQLQTSLLGDLDMLQVKTDVAFDSMTRVLQNQVDAANAQKQALVAGIANPASLDDVIATSLDALASIQNAIAASAGEGDPLVQAQVALLGGLNTIGTAQLTALQDISSKLGGGVHGFAEGSQYIPYSQLAYIHAGESIHPAGDTYGGNTIHLNVNVTGEATTQGASQIADAVIREIEKRSGRYGTTTIVTKR